MNQTGDGRSDETVDIENEVNLFSKSFHGVKPERGTKETTLGEIRESRRHGVRKKRQTYSKQIGVVWSTTVN